MDNKIYKKKSYIAGCTGKVPYLSQKQAIEVTRRWKKKGDPRVYHCKNKKCGFWHITTMNNNVYKDTKKCLKEYHRPSGL